MAGNKTTATELSVATFIASVTPPVRQEEAVRLDALFREATGFQPVLWGPSIIGYGRYHYRYATGRQGNSLTTGFSPRKAAISIYILPGYGDFGPILKDLGKHTLGKSCLYVKHLTDVDLAVLRQLIRAWSEPLRLDHAGRKN